MQSYVYTDEVIRRLSAYAQTIPPSPPATYGLVHPEVQVPRGCLPIRVTQFSRGDLDTYYSHHWSIFIPTSPVPGIGYYYQLAGESPAYHVQRTINRHNMRQGLERGSHTVGYVLPIMLPHLEAHFAVVPVQNLRRSWNSQNWVFDALRGLKHPYVFAVGMTFDELVLQMAIVSTAWELMNAR